MRESGRIDIEHKGESAGFLRKQTDGSYKGFGRAGWCVQTDTLRDATNRCISQGYGTHGNMFDGGEGWSEMVERVTHQ